MIDKIVLDVEIKKTIEELPGGWDDTHLMGVSIACVWEYTTQRMRIYGPEDVKALQDRILQADQVCGYNIFCFDFPVIWKCSKSFWDGPGSIAVATLKARLLPKTNDLLRRIWQSLMLDPDVFNPHTHGGWGLDKVAQATLGGPGKIGYGGDAPKWFQAGLWAKVANYCADDVALERDLTDFVDRYGYVIDTNTQRKVEMCADPGK